MVIADEPDRDRVAHPSRLRADHPRYADIIAAHAEAVERGDSTYDDPETGLAVMTAAYLADSGTCCESGCRHCPYLGREPD